VLGEGGVEVAVEELQAEATKEQPASGSNESAAASDDSQE
jgi:hypothetical protein